MNISCNQQLIVISIDNNTSYHFFSVSKHVFPSSHNGSKFIISILSYTSKFNIGSNTTTMITLYEPRSKNNSISSIKMHSLANPISFLMLSHSFLSFTLCITNIGQLLIFLTNSHLLPIVALLHANPHVPSLVFIFHLLQYIYTPAIKLQGVIVVPSLLVH